jgi:penicillin G amidase
MRAVLFHTPLLRAINLSIAVLLVAVLAIVYWFGWRSMPQTSGDIAAPIGAAATITRDSRGVPHIAAASWEDAVFLQGYAIAQDRMWQMDALRRLASGELAEVVGKAAIESDQEARRWRMQRVAESWEHRLTPSARAIFAAYARGVNYYLETHRSSLAPEFSVLRYDPRPWRVRDSLLVVLQMYRMLASTWRETINKSQMLDAGDAAKVNFLYPRRTGSEVQPGSNAWVISGSRSATGKPILANDPHLEWSVPSEWYLLHLKAPDLDVDGATLPGVPGVVTGHNRRIAWGVTNLGFNIQDLYREQINLENGRYLFQGRIEQARLERDVIAVKGQAPVEVSLWVTRHGPVFLSDGNAHYSMRWIVTGDAPVPFPLLDLDRARNWDEFNAALKSWPGPAQNFVYADVDGNIGYHAAGPLPERSKDCPGDVPVDGASGLCEWQGVIPYEDLPNVYNPPSGMIVTSNQNPFPSDYAWPVDGRFASTYRARQIVARLQSRPQWRPAEMLAVQKDVYSAFSHFLAGQIVAAFDRKSADKNSAAKTDAGNAQVRAAVELLRPWNGQMEKGTAAPMLAVLAYDRIRIAVAERASPGHSANYETSYLAPAMVERLLRERPPDWFPDYDALLLKSLKEAVEAGEKLQGSRISRWDYGQYNELTVENPVFGQVPLIGKYFNIGPVSMSGSSTTVKQTTRRLGPSLRMIVDLSNLDGSLMNVTTGEAGHELSRHYMDQWDSYYAGQSFPMEFGQVRASGVLTIHPQ